MTFVEEIALRQSLFFGLLIFGSAAGLLYAALACCRPRSSWKTVLKAVPLASFAAAAYINFAAPLVIAGLLFSLLGDIALSRDGARAFLIGLIGFALAHLAYSLRFIGLEGDLVPLVPALILGLLAVSTEVWLQPYVGALRLPVRLYVVLICLMGLFAFGLTARPMASLGALAFLASDLLLALQLFRLRPDSGWQVFVSIALWILYVLAQLGILLGAGFAQSLFSI